MLRSTQTPRLSPLHDETTPHAMSIFLLKRLLTLVATLIGASIVVFAVLEVLPGDAAQMLMGPDAEPEAVTAMVQQLGLDQPALTRYWQWITGLLHGDMGDSYVYGSPVAELVWERLGHRAAGRHGHASPPCWPLLGVFEPPTINAGAMWASWAWPRSALPSPTSGLRFF
jgi:hypothetical protein